MKVSPRYQRYFNKINRLYFNGSLPEVKVYTASLLKITQLSQTKASDKKNWESAGVYGVAGLDQYGNSCIVIDKGTSIFHTLLSKQTVLHEAIHFYIHPYQAHGKRFKDQIRRIAALGALDDLV